MKTFEGLNISSKFAICGLPIRLDSYKTCSFGCRYCFSNNRKIMEFRKELQVANVKSIERRLDGLKSGVSTYGGGILDTMILSGITWHCGGMSDPFQPIESEFNITRDIVDVTNKHNVSILFSTKSDNTHNVCIDRDLHSFQLSISNVYDRIDIEPNVPSIDSRLDFFRRLKKDGFKVGIRIQPFIPNITTLDIVKMFEGADHFTLEGIKIVPQNQEQKSFIKDALGLRLEDFTQMGLLNLKPTIRLKMYEPFIDYFKRNGISYSIADNDLRSLGNNKCCCGDALVKRATTFNVTNMIMTHGTHYCLNDVLNELDKYNCANCVVSNLFTSNRVGNCKSIKDFYEKRFGDKKSPFSPKFQHKQQPSLFDL